MTTILKEKESANVDVELAGSGLEVNENLQVNEKSDDVAAAFLAEIAKHPEAEMLLAPTDPAEEKALLRKVDAIVITLLQFALMMGSVDKVSLASASVMGLLTDAHLAGQDYSWTSSIIFFGAIAAIIPSLMLMQRLPANRYIAFNVSLWGIIAMCTAACKTYGQLLAARFILGLFESVIFAGFGLLISMWWTRKEQQFRTGIIFSTLSSVMNGCLAVAAYNYKGTALARWQLLFILVGAITLGWSFLLWAFLPANPTKARWLTLRQRTIATRRMQENHTGIENKTFKLSQFLEAFVDPKTWLIFFINVSINIPNGGLSGFNSIVIKNLGFTTQSTLLLGIPTGLCSWMSSLFWGWVAIKSGKRIFSAMGSIVLPLIGTILLYKLPRTNEAGSLVGIYLVYMFWGPYIVMMGAVYANTGGYTKKLTVYGLSYIGYCVGNIIGPQTFRAKQAPQYEGAIIAMLVGYVAAFFLMGAYYMLLIELNRRKAAKRDLSTFNDSNLLKDFHDDTDFENPHFVYVP